MTHKAHRPAAVPSLDDHICLGVYSAGLAIQRTYKPMLDKFGITYLQYLVLNLLWERDLQSVGELATQLQLESSTLTPLLKRLEINDFILRKRNPDNERQVVVKLTDRGSALRTEAGCITQTLLEKSGLDINAIAELNKSVRVLRDNLYDNQDDDERSSHA